MIRATLLSLLCLVSIGTMAQKNNAVYNKVLADSLGADERGMKMYVLVILKTGPAPEVSQPVRDSLMKGHFGFISRMSDKGLLVMAGPLEKNDRQYRGIYVFNVPTVEQARLMATEDPSIQAGFFAVELFGFYGSAALPMLAQIHYSLQKTR